MLRTLGKSVTLPTKGTVSTNININEQWGHFGCSSAILFETSFHLQQRQKTPRVKRKRYFQSGSDKAKTSNCPIFPLSYCTNSRLNGVLGNLLRPISFIESGKLLLAIHSPVTFITAKYNIHNGGTQLHITFELQRLEYWIDNYQHGWQPLCEVASQARFRRLLRHSNLGSGEILALIVPKVFHCLIGNSKLGLGARKVEGFASLSCRRCREWKSKGKNSWKL